MKKYILVLLLAVSFNTHAISDDAAIKRMGCQGLDKIKKDDIKLIFIGVNMGLLSRGLLDTHFDETIKPKPTKLTKKILRVKHSIIDNAVGGLESKKLIKLTKKACTKNYALISVIYSALLDELDKIIKK